MKERKIIIIVFWVIGICIISAAYNINDWELWILSALIGAFAGFCWPRINK